MSSSRRLDTFYPTTEARKVARWEADGQTFEQEVPEALVDEHTEWVEETFPEATDLRYERPSTVAARIGEARRLVDELLSMELWGNTVAGEGDPKDDYLRPASELLKEAARLLEADRLADDEPDRE